MAIKNYLLIVFWQVISVVLNLASLFVYTPYLTSDSTTYGIYSLVISLLAYVALLDFGFNRVATKYGAECVGRGELNIANETIAKAGIVTIVAAILLSGLVLVAAKNPEWLFRSELSAQQTNVAGSLLFILSLAIPLSSLQTTLTNVYVVRMKESFVYRLFVMMGLIKLFAFYVFFYDRPASPVAYFLMLQLANLIFTLILLVDCQREFDFFSNLKWRFFLPSASFIRQHHRFAFNYFLASLMGVISLQADLPIIERTLGLEASTKLAPGLTLFNVLGTLIGAGFSPLSTIMTYYYTRSNYEGIKKLLSRSMIIFFPFTALVAIAPALLMQKFISTWIGSHYADVWPVYSLLLMCWVTYFVQQPLGILLVVSERLRSTNYLNFILTIGYIVFLLNATTRLGIFSVAIAKLTIMSLPSLAYFFLIPKEARSVDYRAIAKLALSMTVSLGCSWLLASWIVPQLPESKSSYNLALVLVSCAAVAGGGFMSYLICSSRARYEYSQILWKIIRRVSV